MKITNLKHVLFTCILSVLPFFHRLCLAQEIVFTLENDIPVKINEKILQNPWMGGLNAPQFSTTFLNDDELPDLVIFDRTNNKISTFLVQKNGEAFYYQHAPQYEFLFPKLTYWLLLRDYDQDGDKDIFTHHQLGLSVYKNLKKETSQIEWEIIQSPIFTEGFSGEINLQIPASDIPIIIDLDEDGDLDILTFDYIGERMELHQNFSQELGYGSDSLIYKKVNSCWGDFAEGFNCGEFYFDLNCEPIQKRQGKGGGEGKLSKPLHLGSSSLLLNLNGDKSLDLLVGDVSCSEASVFLNEKKNWRAKFTEMDRAIFKNHPISIPIFPAFFAEDVTFDGKKDLLVSPNVFINEGEMIDFSSSVWLYEQVGTEKKPEFIFQKKNFLQESILDFGEDTYPALLDYDQDGDLDLFVSNGGELHTDGFYAQIRFFENTGNATKPSFELLDSDFLNFSEKKVKQIQLQFQKVNEDETPDLLVTFQDSSEQKQILFFPYLKQSSQFSWENVEIYPLDLSPQENVKLYDVNQDNILDALILNQIGNISFLENQGDNLKPNWLEKSTSFLGIEKDSQKQNPHLVLTDFQQDTILDMLLMDDSGNLKMTQVPFFLESQPQFFAHLIWNDLEVQRNNFYFGKKLSLSVGDLNADTIPDIIIGTNTGGLVLLMGSSK